MFNRVVTVEFIAANGQIKRLEGIDVRFNVKKYMGQVMNEANIEIWNLPQEDIEYLTTFTSQWIAINQRKRIRISAGYKDTNIGLLFDGDIVEALPSVPPDVCLRCKARSGAYGNSTIISKSITNPVSVKDVFKQASQWTGLTINDYTTTNRKLDSFFYTGSATQLINQINNIPDIIAYEDDGALCIVDKAKPDIKKGIRLVNKDSGMIGIPQPDALGVKVRLLLDPNIRIGQQIKVESIAIPACNGIYTIYELEHSGELRGSDFYTEITARR